MRAAILAVSLALATGLVLPVAAAETPKRGGTFTYMIPAEAPPSLDAHRESTYATLHSVAPYYSLLLRVDPEEPTNTTRFVCDLCLEIPAPTDGGKTYRFKLRQDVRFHDGSKLTSADVLASWRKIIDPPKGVLSARQGWYSVVESVEAPDPSTIIFRLKFAATTFLPSLADPHSVIYPKVILDKDPHWFEKNVLGSGPFRFTGYTIGQSITGERNNDYYHRGLPYLDKIIGLYAPKQSVRLSAIRADRAAMEFRGLPPSAEQQLKQELGDKLSVQRSASSCRNLVTPNHTRKPFDDVRVRRALLLAIDQWGNAEALSKIANVRTVGSLVYPGSPLAATREELWKLAGFWPDINKSRAEARRLLKEAGAEGLEFELLNRNVDQPYKYIGVWLVDEWSKIGVKAKQKVLPTGPWLDAMRSGDFTVAVEGNCNDIINPVLDVQKFLPPNVSSQSYGGYKDPEEVAIYERMLHETDPARQRVLMRDYETRIVDTEAHVFPLLWWERIIPYRSYVKGWKIGPSNFVNQDLANIWLDQ